MLAVRRFLLEPSQPLWRYCLLAGALAWLPSVVLLNGVYLVLQMIGMDSSALLPRTPELTLWGLFSTVVLAPVSETLILAWILTVLASTGKSRIFVVSCSAILWGLLHSLGGRLWFFGVVWSFFVFSAAYLAWRPISFKHAFAAAAVPHAIVNMITMTLIFLGQPDHPLPQTDIGRNQAIGNPSKIKSSVVR